MYDLLFSFKSLSIHLHGYDGYNYFDRKYMMLEIKEGSKYGMLTVLKEGPRKRLPSKQVNRTIICRCDCGVECSVRVARLVRNKNICCGCKIYHGDTSKPLYQTWRGMIGRTSKTAIDAHRYFYRGITVCDHWKKYINFRDWALVNGYSEGLQIDRINNDKGYHPDNCRFVDVITNANNREVTFMVTYKGERESLKMILHRLKINGHYNTIFRRIVRGWSGDDAIDTPIKKGNYNNRWRTQIV